ncbi:MAG: hypothetical protein ACI4QG_04575, partial [Candidatus Cryptobacteroides sp.]
ALANESGESRIATFNLGVPAEYTEEMERVQTLTLLQGAAQAFIKAGTPPVFLPDAQDCSVSLESNIAAVSSDFNVISSENFVRDARIETSGKALCLRFSLEENRTGNPRASSVTVTYRDLDGNITRESITIQQN